MRSAFDPPTASIDRAHGLATLLPLATWSCYAPLGVKYATVGLCVVVSVAWLAREPGGWRWPATRGAGPIAVAWLFWLGVSIVWTPAGAAIALGVFGQYALMLLLATIAVACPPNAARRALAHFAVASTLVAATFALEALRWLPASTVLWHTTVDAEGNQRIATSTMLALGAALAGWQGADAPARARLAWWAGAALCTGALALQDRRSGMLLLPMLLLVWAWSRETRAWQRLVGSGLVVTLVTTVWLTSPGVQQRFDEGLRELKTYRANDQVATSWGQRLRMWQLTTEMVAERPWLGHGLGSWKLRWTERVTRDTPLAGNTTPHNEYLLLAQQAGLAAPLLLLGWLGVGMHQARRAGQRGVPALLALASIAWMGLFHAVLRDAKFALPLLLLAALGAAAARDDTNPPSGASG